MHGPRLQYRSSLRDKVQHSEVPDMGCSSGAVPYTLEQGLVAEESLPREVALSELQYRLATRRPAGPISAPCPGQSLTAADWARLQASYQPYATVSCQQLDLSRWLIHTFTALVHLGGAAVWQTGSLLNARAAQIVLPFLLLNLLHGSFLRSSLHQHARNACVVGLWAANIGLVVWGVPTWVEQEVSSWSQLARALTVSTGSIATFWQAIVHQLPWPANALMTMSCVAVCSWVLHPSVCARVTAWPQGQQAMTSLQRHLDWGARQVLPLPLLAQPQHAWQQQQQEEEAAAACASIVNMYHATMMLVVLLVMWVNHQRTFAAFLRSPAAAAPKPIPSWPVMPLPVAAVMLLLVSLVTLACTWQLVQVPGGALAAAGAWGQQAAAPVAARLQAAILAW